jgi:hypothetical protein
MWQNVLWKVGTSAFNVTLSFGGIGQVLGGSQSGASAGGRSAKNRQGSANRARHVYLPLLGVIPYFAAWYKISPSGGVLLGTRLSPSYREVRGQLSTIEMRWIS